MPTARLVQLANKKVCEDRSAEYGACSCVAARGGGHTWRSKNGKHLPAEGGGRARITYYWDHARYRICSGRAVH